MFEKYILIDNDKYKATVSQSKTTGMWFGEASVKAGSRKELKSELEGVLSDLTKVMNGFNKQNKKEKVPPATPPKEKSNVRMG